MATATLSTTEVKTGADFLKRLADTLSDETSLRQALTLFEIAMAGTAGTDSATIERKLGISAAAVSRTIRVLSEISWDRTKGYGLVDLTLDPADNRRRIIKVNRKGLDAINKVCDGLCRKR